MKVFDKNNPFSSKSSDNNRRAILKKEKLWVL